MASAYVITGLKDTGIHPRLEIRDLQTQNRIQFSLFIRAWNKLHNKRDGDPSSPDYIDNPISSWQQGAIHGRPYAQWSGDPNGPKDSQSPFGGYCYHKAALYPTWHRAQTLLIEQAVVSEAIKIATELEKTDPVAKKEGWVQKAKELRFPFWDWTKLHTAQEGIPEIFQLPKIQIINPGCVYGPPVDNPLNHYRFANIRTPGGETPMGKWSRTYRWVDDINNPTKEQYDLARDSFRNGQRKGAPIHSLRRKIAALFTYPISDSSYGPNFWGYFSNSVAENIYLPDGINESFLYSIEEPHSAVHFHIGGQGTMSVIDYSGFDPIVHLHHCNVDRIYAFWEYIYPEYWIGKGWKNAQGGTTQFRTGTGGFHQAPGSPVDDDTSLAPFRVEESVYWSSNRIRSLLNTSQWQKYYTYPAIVYGSTRVEVHKPYGAENREKYRQAVYNEWGTGLTTDVGLIRDNPLRNLLLEEEGEYSYLRNFIIIGEVPEFAFPGSYRLELYLLPEDPHDTIKVIDSVTVFGRINSDECTACRDRRAAGSRVRGHMHLDPALILDLIDRYGTKEAEDPGWPNLIERARDESNSLDWLTNVIKGRFGLRVVDPAGKTLASADPHIGADGEDLEVAKKPRLTLHSHRVKFNPSTADYIPLTMEEGVKHGEFELGYSWKIVS